jgi:hypothetical protein
MNSLHNIHNIILECCYVNNMECPDFTSLMKIKKYDNIYKLFNSEYTIFLTNKFFAWKKIKLLKYFDKYETVYLDYNNKFQILKLLNTINNLIIIYDKFVYHHKNTQILNNSSQIIFDLVMQSKNICKMDDYTKNIITYKLINDFKNILNVQKLKLVYFSENNIEPNILYKKIQFSREEVFFLFENYVIKKREYKLRTFCQIAEKLGAINIEIKSDINNTLHHNISGKVSLPDQKSI